MFTLKLTQIGNSVGVILPKELLARFKLEEGLVGIHHRDDERLRTHALRSCAR